jgi:hypothetical protein
VSFCSITIRVNTRCICAVHSYRLEQITLKFKVLLDRQMIKLPNVVRPVPDKHKIRNLYEPIDLSSGILVFKQTEILPGRIK